MPTALIQGRVATEHTDRLRSLVGSDWEVLEWDPRKQEVDAFAPMLVQADVVMLQPWFDATGTSRAAACPSASGTMSWE